MASWYGAEFHGRRTANGEIFDQRALTAAHPTLPLPSYVRVTNLDNDRSLVVRVNDRGPYRHGRLIDVSERAAEMLGFQAHRQREGARGICRRRRSRRRATRLSRCLLSRAEPLPGRRRCLGHSRCRRAGACAATSRRAPASPEPVDMAVAAVPESDPPSKLKRAGASDGRFCGHCKRGKPPGPRRGGSAVTDTFEADDRISMVFDLLPQSGQ